MSSTAQRGITSSATIGRATPSPASIDTSSWNTWSLIGVLAALVGHTARLASPASEVPGDVELGLVAATAAGELVDLAAGDDVPLTFAPQGGHILLVAPRIRDLAACTVDVTAALRDKTNDRVVDLGLVYGVDVVGDQVHLRLTMTTPACPLGGEIVRDAETCLAGVPGVGGVHVELVWDPPWSPALMSPAARASLGWGG